MWYMGEESVPGTENSKCKGSGQGKAQNDLENVRTIVTGALRVRERMARDKNQGGRQGADHLCPCNLGPCNLYGGV